MTELLLGRVSWEPNNQASYVRVSIPQHCGIPLAIKATFTGFDRHNLTKGVMVEVERSNPDDARRYRVVRAYKDNDDGVTMTVFHIKTENAEAFRKGNTMPSSQAGQMSQDRVRFWLPSNYYNSGHSVAMCVVLKKAFGMGHVASEDLMRGSELGFWIVCRPSQFGRFLIYRNEAGIKNGFMDLKAALHVPTQNRDVYKTIGDLLNMSPSDVYKVTNALGFTSSDIREHLDTTGRDFGVAVDVSKNSHRGV